jgi:membrane-bound lytic murein transglycosylase A
MRPGCLSKRVREMKWYAALCALLLLTSCAETSTTEKRELTPVSFSDLPGWSSDHISEAIPAFLRSCAVLTKSPADKNLGIAGKASDWAGICRELENVPLQDSAAWTFFESKFQPYAITSSANNAGLFTGYYEPELRGSLHAEGIYQTPLYAEPDDLISVDLGAFKKDLKGQHIVGKVTGHKLEPYDDRAAIASGSLQSRARVLAYVDDPVDAFFLEVQGSGNITLTDGTRMRVGYAGANGHAYVAIGRALSDKGLIEKPVTMQKIRDWMKAHPERRDEIMNLNLSYVFFKRIDGDGPIGAEGVALTPQRSLAVDPANVPLGVPLWLDTVDGNNAPLQRLVMAQDTGGAIKGIVRGDFFWGSGDAAAAQAGAMQSKGHYFILLPKHVTNAAE